MAPSYYWTWRLLAFGFTLQQCVTIRNLPWEVLLDHALRAAEEGRPLAIESCLPEPLLAELRRVVGDASPAQIRVLLPDLPPGTLYEEVQLYLACRRAVPRR